MRMLGGVVAVVLLFTVGAQAEVVCVRAKKDGTLKGALKVRTECKRREVQIDPALLGLCCQPGATTSTTIGTTTTTDPSATTSTTIGTTTTTDPGATTSTTIGTTTTTDPGVTTSTSTTGSSSTTTITTVPTTATSTSTSSSIVTTITILPPSSTSTSTTTTTSLTCPSITTTTVIIPNCGGNPLAACFGYCSNGKQCASPDNLSCSCSGPLLPCGMNPDGQCGGTCESGQVCTQVINVGGDGCPESYGCACLPL